MTITTTARLAAGGLAMAAIMLGSLAAFGAGGTGAQSAETSIKVTAPEAPVKEGDDPITLTVTTENVENLAAFQFILLYDDSIFSYESYQKGEFLGSTEREVVCNEVSDAGAFKLNCVSFRPTPPGPNGSGVLATIVLKPKGSGETDITLDRVKMSAADEAATEIPVPTITNVTIDVEGVSGFNWLIWGPIIALGGLAAIGVVVFGAKRMSGGKPAA